MPDNGIDWIKRFGKPPGDMDEGEWRIAVAVLLMEACQYKGLSKSVDHLKYTIAGIAIALAALWTLFSTHVFGK